jgi:predicted TIM-barrel enzyme
MLATPAGTNGRPNFMRFFASIVEKLKRISGSAVRNDPTAVTVDAARTLRKTPLIPSS